MPATTHRETHRSERIRWLRAAVLGAQDGIVSTASLILGVAAASSSRSQILIAGIAALVAGATSMAAGEYGSVSSQRDTELADIERETRELARFPDHELDELTQIYEQRGLDHDLARQVATQLTEQDALGSHIRDELGMHESTNARPVQAATISALSFAVGSLLSIVAAATIPAGARIAAIAVLTLALLGGLGYIGAKLGGAPTLRATMRITIGGGIAMGVTALIGSVVGTLV